MIDERQLTVFEYDEISCGSGDKQLSKECFEQLRDLVLPENNNAGYNINDLSACMTLGSRRGKEVIRVGNHVGVISLKNGFVVEVLPKIADNMTEKDIPFARTAVTEMLRSSGIIPYKTFQKARLYACKMNLWEVYIRLFLDEVSLLYKKGLKADYEEYENNRNFLKGKLLFGENIKRNYIRKDKFYVRYDLFDFNCAENRLIKSVLIYLKRKSGSSVNKRDIRMLLACLDDIELSNNYDADLSKCRFDRSAKDYGSVIEMCRVFLQGKSYTSFGGKSSATALLFPMNKLFESFFARVVSSVASENGYDCSVQYEDKYLFENGGRSAFGLCPDIVLKNRNDDSLIIVDTKWKKLNSDKSNFGISQADMYQMYAYHTRYENVKKVVLVYPLYRSLNISDYTTRVGDMTVTVSVVTFDIIGYFKDKASDVSKRFFEYLYPSDGIFGK